MSYLVCFYTTKSGRLPVKIFIDEQTKVIRARIVRSIELLQTLGPYLKPPYSKKLDKHLYELRITGRVSIRILYTYQRKKYILLHAFHKKTQKTPLRELKTAIDRLKDTI